MGDDLGHHPCEEARHTRVSPQRTSARPTVELTGLILHTQDRVCDAVGPLFGLIRRDVHASVDWLTLKKTTCYTALHDILSISSMTTFVPDCCGIIVPADLRVDRDIRVSSQVSRS